MFQEKEYGLHSFETMDKNGIDSEEIKKCIHESFVLRESEGKVDYDLDDNTLLHKE